MKELERFLLSLNSPMTKKYYTINLNSFFEFKKISKIEDVKNLTIDDIEDWDLYLKEIQNSQNSRRIKLAAISSFYDYLIARDIVVKNIVKPIIKKLKVDTKEQSFLTASEVVRMLKVAKNKREYAIMMVLVNCGLRVSELINLKLKDYQDDKLNVINGKGGKDRVVYLNSTTKQAIDSYLIVRKQSEYDNLFVSNNGAPMATFSLDRTVKKLVKNAGIEKNISCHSLRRTLATDLYAEGVDLITIKNILGHSSTQNTQIYIKNQNFKVEETMKSYNYEIRGTNER